MKTIPIRHIQEVRTEPSLLGSFSIRRIEEILDGKDMVQELHGHDYFHMLVLEEARGIHEIDFIAYDITEYSLFTMRPGQVHKLEIKAGSTGFLIQFDKPAFYSEQKQLPQLLRTVSSQNDCKLDNAGYENIKSMLQIIKQEFDEKQAGYEDSIRSGLHILFVKILRNRRNAIPIETNSYAQDKLETFYELLESNIKDRKQVADYAGMLNLSHYQLSDITKSALNKRPSDLINEHIILEAKRQLLATSNQVSNIAYDLGYEDASYFIRFFKKHTGYAPELFRNNFK